jgi:hypothetical protein
MACQAGQIWVCGQHFWCSTDWVVSSTQQSSTREQRSSRDDSQQQAELVTKTPSRCRCQVGRNQTCLPATPPACHPVHLPPCLPGPWNTHAMCTVCFHHGGPNNSNHASNHMTSCAVGCNLAGGLSKHADGMLAVAGLSGSALEGAAWRWQQSCLPCSL